MSRVRVLFTIPNFLTAGSGREMFNIIERLDKDIFEPFIAVNQVGGALYEEILEKGYPVITEKFCVEEQKTTLNKFLSAFSLARKFKPYNFQIWQSFNWSSDYTEALVARFSGARYVYVKKNMNWNRLAWKIKSKLSNAIVARNSTLINGPFSEPGLQYKTFFVPGGVSTELGVAVESDLRSRLKIPSSATLISCVAQLVKVKDQTTLICAVSGIDNIYLVLAGAKRDIEYANHLRQLIIEKKLEERVFLLGSVSDIRGLLHASDIFVLPTTNKDGHEEGCPVALLEAMVAGVPCIASDVAGSRDLIKHEETGLIFTPGEPTKLAECIRYYLANPDTAKTFARRAQEMAIMNYSLEKEAAAFSNVYKKMLNL